MFGGLLFGLGMALVGTCGFGTLVRLGGGDLRSLVDMATIGFFGYLTLSGPIAYLRLSMAGATDLTLADHVAPSLVDALAGVAGWTPDAVRPIIALIITLAMITFCFRHGASRPVSKEIAAALAIGLVVTLAWLVTGALGQDPFDPRPPVALSFVRPLGESFLYLMLMSGMSLDFGIASVAGVLLGAHLVARAKRELRREGFDGDREMARHFTGAALMGVGGVLAFGCTIGQGISAMSTLALSAPLALIAIFIGAAFGLRYLEEGSVTGAFKVMTGRLSS